MLIYQQALDKIKELYQEPIINITKLNGLTNNNYLITTSNRNLVLKILHKDLQNNRNNEYLLNQKLAKLKITPKIIYKEQEKFFIIEYIEGIIGENYNFNQSSVEQLYNIFSFLHNLQFDFIKELDIFYKIKQYLTKIYESDYYNSLNLLCEKLQNIKEQFPKNQKFCHNDVNLANIIINNNQLYILDFEYAAYNDAFFDLAAIKIMFPAKAANIFLDLYYNNLLKDQFDKTTFNNKLEYYQQIIQLTTTVWYFFMAYNKNSNGINKYLLLAKTEYANLKKIFDVYKIK
ncbi:phosphotransferase [Rickettsiales bacterium LUAb2]